jgi:hypothetical protein
MATIFNLRTGVLFTSIIPSYAASTSLPDVAVLYGR